MSIVSSNNDERKVMDLRLKSLKIDDVKDTAATVTSPQDITDNETVCSDAIISSPATLPPRPSAKIRTFHLSCTSSPFNSSFDYVGMIFYDRCDVSGFRIQPGYIVIKDVNSPGMKAVLSYSSDGNTHKALFKTFSGIDADDDKKRLIEGFSYKAGNGFEWSCGKDKRMNPVVANLVDTYLKEVWVNKNFPASKKYMTVQELDSSNTADVVSVPEDSINYFA
jgi:hypothetical protein